MPIKIGTEKSVLPHVGQRPVSKTGTGSSSCLTQTSVGRVAHAAQSSDGQIVCNLLSRRSTSRSLLNQDPRPQRAEAHLLVGGPWAVCQVVHLEPLIDAQAAEVKSWPC